MAEHLHLPCSQYRFRHKYVMDRQDRTMSFGSYLDSTAMMSVMYRCESEVIGWKSVCDGS